MSCLPSSGWARKETISPSMVWTKGDEVRLDWRISYPGRLANYHLELPEPRIPYLDQARTNAQPQLPSPEAAKASPVRPPKPRQASFGIDPTTDPWASPSNNRMPPSSTAGPGVSTHSTSPEGVKSSQNGIARTTSAFTTGGQDGGSGSPSAGRSSQSEGPAWNSFNGSSGGFSEQPTLGGGFGDPGDDRSSNHPARQSTGATSQSVTLPPGTGESVAITMLPEKEGMFLFQHRNYEVKTLRRGSSVVRRYSDFVWLLDCLQKRYPFRRLPLLPPKRVQGRVSFFS
jgi:sorting nexin-8